MLVRTLALLCGAALANAMTIVSVDGPVTFIGSVGNNQALTAGFSTGQAYGNVTISALFSGPAGETVDAYLTTSIGPGTTIADEFASTTVNFPGFNPGALTPVFSGLNLPAGTYYLTLFNPDTTSGGWSSTNAPAITTDAGAAHVFSGYFITNDMPLPYPPASDFADLLVEEDRTLIYDVTQIPEPATAYTAVFVLAGIAALRVRSKRAGKESRS